MINSVFERTVNEHPPLMTVSSFIPTSPRLGTVFYKWKFKKNVLKSKKGKKFVRKVGAAAAGFLTGGPVGALAAYAGTKGENVPLWRSITRGAYRGAGGGAVTQLIPGAGSQGGFLSSLNPMGTGGTGLAGQGVGALGNLMGIGGQGSVPSSGGWTDAGQYGQYVPEGGGNAGSGNWFTDIFGGGQGQGGYLGGIRNLAGAVGDIGQIGQEQKMARLQQDLISQLGEDEGGFRARMYREAEPRFAASMFKRGLQGVSAPGQAPTGYESGLAKLSADIEGAAQDRRLQRLALLGQQVNPYQYS